MRGTCSPGFRLESHGAAEQVLPGSFADSSEQTMVPYSHIDRVGAKAGWFSLFRLGDRKGFVLLPMAAENFWPGAALLGQLSGVGESAAE